MTDTFLHILLGLVIAFLVNSIILVFGPTLGAFAVAALVIFFREVTQRQTSHYDSDFRKAWDFWHWSGSKNLETWVPMAAVLGVGTLVQRLAAN